MAEFTILGVELPPSPFAEQHRMIDQMLRSESDLIEMERIALRNLKRRKTWLSPMQRYEIGSSKKPRMELAEQYHISPDHVTRLKQQYQRGEL